MTGRHYGYSTNQPEVITPSPSAVALSALAFSSDVGQLGCECLRTHRDAREARDARCVLPGSRYRLPRLPVNVPPAGGREA